jgi:hypothetical protein
MCGVSDRVTRSPLPVPADFGRYATSDASLLYAPKRTFANVSPVMASRRGSARCPLSGEERILGRTRPKSRFDQMATF